MLQPLVAADQRRDGGRGRGGRWWQLAGLARRDDEAVREIRARIDLVELVSESVMLKKSGRDFIGLCPFHEEKTPSFHVTPDRGLYYCYGCHAGGDAFTFVMQRQGSDFRAAVAELAARTGVRLSERRAANPKALRERDRLEQALEDAACFFQTMVDDAAARAYLSRRGVAGESAARFRLGFAPPAWDELLRALTRKGHSPEILERAGLIVRRAQGDGFYDRFRGRLMFPICDERGVVIAFGGRSVGDEQPKYLNSPESPLFSKRRTLYGLHLAREAARREQRMVVVEGYMDVVMAHQYGFASTVASLGTALSPEQAGGLARHAERVLVAYDADAAGDAATLRGLGVLQGTAARVAVVSVGSGMDPDELLRRVGAAALGAALDAALPLVEYVVARAVERRDVRGRLEDRLAAAEEVAPFVARCREPERSYYAEWAARRCLLEPHVFAPLWRRLVEKGTTHSAGGRWNNTKDSAQDTSVGPVTGARKAQEGLLALMAVDGEHLRCVGARLGTEDFDSGVRRDLARALFAVADALSARGGTEENGGCSPGELALETEEDPQVRALLGRLLAAPPPTGDPERAREDWVGFLERQRLQSHLDALRMRLRQGEVLAAHEQDELRGLLAKIKRPAAQRSYADG